MSVLCLSAVYQLGTRVVPAVTKGVFRRNARAEPVDLDLERLIAEPPLTLWRGCIGKGSGAVPQVVLGRCWRRHSNAAASVDHGLGGRLRYGARKAFGAAIMMVGGATQVRSRPDGEEARSDRRVMGGRS